MKAARLGLLVGAAISAATVAYLALSAVGVAPLAELGRGIATDLHAPDMTLAQADEEIPPDQIDKYVAVYKAMQRNHSLSVEQAAAAQGLTLRAFRDLEQRIERNDVARDDARRALAESAQEPTPSAHGSPRTSQP